MQEEKSPWMKIFSERLKTALKGRRQSDISKEIGIGQPNLSMYVKGENKPSLEVFRALCVSLGMNADWLLGLTDARGSAPGAATATNGSAAAVGNATATVAAPPSLELSRLLSIIESQQRVIETLSGRP